VAIGPRRGDHRVAVRAALSVAVPLLIVWAIGRLDLGIYASFGAFASLYGRHDAYPDRIRMQLAAGAAVVAAMLVGTALSVLQAPDAVCVLVVAAVAAVGTLVSWVSRWHPPGALFHVFAAGATATLPADGHTFTDVLLVGGGSVLFAVALTLGIALTRGGLHRGPVRPRERVGATGAEMALTVGMGTLLAGMLALLLLGSHWYWAMVGAVAALGGAHVTARLVRGAQRLLGTLVGVLVAAGLLAVQLPPLATIGVAVLLQAGAELYVGRNYGIAMVFVTPLALLMVQLAAPVDPALLLRDRVIDTVIGVAVGTVVAMLSSAIRRRTMGGHPDPV
jgi:uncharacterized membrane protein YccC